ncbi:AmmeMemoRadiSam system protein B [Methylococcus sp. EFPC2]|uniref:AmmeMemoRadiSam system protein B n=1 Tax=Methylococcus sp. EFPC2 TaxID=2812648 RepID=UPI0019678054|nr:AmmeMemoRadiSam system protein B [Methylococcus sp. EFPC2]QSA98314.1 AmmeMemoRadiSam system protein B [Methylococcus sp. EFPC2]
MRTVRQPAVAGLFYPGDSRQLHAAVQAYLAESHSTGTVPKALVAPHAGYIYSAPIAATAYSRLAVARDSINRVVLLGPSHRVGFQGLAVSSADAFVTPLGEVPLDRTAIARLAELPFVRVLDEAHLYEHSLEVHLPFLQEVLAAFVLTPIVVGDAEPDQVAQALDSVWGGAETLIVVSSDLSHYHDYATARRMDAATSQAIESLRPEDIDYEQACGRLPVAGLLQAARSHGLKAKTIDLRNSGDTAGDKNRVVGYGAYVFE